MATKLQLITDLYGDTAKQVTDSVDGWKSYLTSAARLYKYTFDEQLLIYAQRPDATACAAMELWNGKMNRWVKPGSKGIALIHKNASGKPHLEYVFDVADTRPVRGAKTPWLWEMSEELQAPALARLETRYGETTGDYGDRLMELAARAVGESYREHLSDLTYDMEDSFLEGLDDLNLDVRFRNILTASVQFTLLTRCGLDPSRYLEDEDLQGITEFSTTAVLSHIGNAASDISGTMLVEIGNAIRETERNIARNLQNPLANQPVIGYTEVTQEFNALKRERSIEHGRVDIPEERGLSDSQPHDGGNGNGGNLGQVRDAAADLFAGTPERDVHLNADDGQTVAASAGHRPDGTGTGGQHPEALDGAERRERETESSRPDEVGAGSEQLETDGRGSSAEGTDLQLTEQNTPPESDSKTLSDFVSTQPHELLFGLLQNDQFLKAKRPAIAEYFEQHPEADDRATYMRSLHDDAYTELDVGATRVGYLAQEDGLTVWSGHYLTRTSESKLSWDVVQGLTADMMERGVYLTPEDKPLKPSLVTPPAFQQITLFPSVEQQIENIAEAQAEEKRSPAFFDAPARSVPQDVIDRVLSSGSNKWQSIERIVANYQKDRTGSAHVGFLKEEYGTGGKGFSIGGRDYAVSFDEDGLRIAPGRRANVPNCTVIPWIQVAVRIQQLLSEGQFATQEKIDAARPNERKELAESLWYLRQNLSDEAHKQGYMPILSENYGGFPDSTQKIAALLLDPIQREAVISEVSDFADTYSADRNLLRWRQYQPQAILRQLEGLRQEPTPYTAAPGFEAARPSFITEDEIDEQLASGSGFSEGKMRIASYFMQGHEPAEAARFLREEYGTGGGGQRGYNSNYDSKGYSFSRSDEISGYGGYDKLSLNWNQMEKRIRGLIKADRYLNANEKTHISEYEALIVARQVYTFFRYAPKDEPQGYSWDWDSDSAKRDYVPKLTDPEKAAELLGEMRQIAAFLPPDYRYRDTMERALADTERYVSGEYSLFTPLAPELLQAERSKKQAKRTTPTEKAPVDNLAAAARALARKKPSTMKETGNGQLSFDFLSMGAAAEPQNTPELATSPEVDEEAEILAAHADEIDEAQALLEERGYVTDSEGLFLDALERLDENPTAVEIADAAEEILLEDEQEIIQNSYDLGYGHMGNGLTVWNQLEQVDGDYKTIAHISPSRTVTYYDENLPELIKAQIEGIAATSEMTISATQDAPVFQTPPAPEPRTPEPAPTKPMGEGERAIKDIYSQWMPVVVSRVLNDETYQNACRNSDEQNARTELDDLLDKTALDILPEDSGFYNLYTGMPAFHNRLRQEVFAKTYEVLAALPEQADVPESAHPVSEDVGIYAAQSPEPNLTPLAEAYINLKAQHPDRLIGVKVGDHYLFYGMDAEAAAPALGTKIAIQNILGLGNVNVTGTNRGWQSDLSRLLSSGHSVLFASPSEENPTEYDIIKERTAAEYIPIGMELLIDGRRMQIDSVNFDAGKVSLRDLDLKGWFPIFREESVAFVRSYVEEQQTIGDIEPAHQQADAREESRQLPPDPVEIEGGRLVDVVIDLRPREPEQTRPAQNRHNFHITDDNLGAGGQKAKYQANIAAIRTLKQIEAEHRLATPEEQETLSRYVGWGGIADAFDPNRENWTKEYAELKDLLTPEEYQSAQGSVLNAHYTSPTVIKAMYAAVEQMGLHPGNILEPAMGVGNFFGLVPESMESARLYGVELDSLTGRIAKQLYQKADITISGFEKTDRRDFYDLAVGNVPFGQYKVSDKPYDKLNFPIHDYFLAKGVDQLRPGGIMAVVTSHYTLDKQNPAARQYLAKRADLLGAIRLPNNAFRQNAGTEVTTDILFFQKRDHAPEREPEWVQLGETADAIRVNRYFADNPQMILGKMVEQSGQFGTEITCAPKEGEILSEQLAAAIKLLVPPDKELLSAEPPETADSIAARESIPADPNVRNFSFALVEGALYFRENSRMNPVELGKTPTERVKGMLSIRDCARRLIDLQLMGAPESEIEREQVRLNVLYDRFTKSYGLLNSLGNKQAFESDSSYPLLCSLEIVDEEGNLERKADMFTKRTIQRHSPVTSVDTAAEALAVSIGEKACVDLGYMASLMGGSEKLDTIIHDLQGVIFKDPTSDQGDPYTGWQTADEYLSGNVRQKLVIAQTAAETNPEYAINVEKLTQIQP